MFILGLIVGVILTLVAIAIWPMIWPNIRSGLIRVEALYAIVYEIMTADKELLEAVVNHKQDPYKQWIIKFAQWRLAKIQ